MLTDSTIVNASDLTVSKKGDFIEEKWICKKKEFIKLHIAVDAKLKKRVSFRVTKGDVHDSKEFCSVLVKVVVKAAAQNHYIDIPFRRITCYRLLPICYHFLSYKDST